MRLPRVWFTIRRLLAVIAVVAVLIPLGSVAVFQAREMWQLRRFLLDRAARVGANEQMARKIIATPRISPGSYAYWSGYAEQCARVRQHCERAARRPWRVPGPDPL